MLFESYAALLAAAVSRLLLRLRVLLGLRLLVVLLGGGGRLVGPPSPLRHRAEMRSPACLRQLHLQQVLTDGDGIILVDQELLDSTSLGSVDGNVDLWVGKGYSDFLVLLDVVTDLCAAIRRRCGKGTLCDRLGHGRDLNDLLSCKIAVSTIANA
ncbi:hypothetical protein KCU94_g5, partial [Aureobasidium melanogenum]